MCHPNVIMNLNPGVLSKFISYSFCVMTLSFLFHYYKHTYHGHDPGLALAHSPLGTIEHVKLHLRKWQMQVYERSPLPLLLLLYAAGRVRDH